MIEKETKKPDKPEDEQEIRDNKGRFIEGKSGNLEGRPFGSKNRATIEKKVAEDEFKQRVFLHLQSVLTAQLNIAKGASYLYRIEEEENSKKRKHVLVTDPEEIREVLDECEGEGTLDDKYYYITTKEPDNSAIDSLIDRVFDRPKSRVDIGGQILTTPTVNIFLEKNQEVIRMADTVKEAMMKQLREANKPKVVKIEEAKVKD